MYAAVSLIVLMRVSVRAQHNDTEHLPHGHFT